MPCQILDPLHLQYAKLHNYITKPYYLVPNALFSISFLHPNVVFIHSFSPSLLHTQPIQPSLISVKTTLLCGQRFRLIDIHNCPLRCVGDVVVQIMTPYGLVDGYQSFGGINFCVFSIDLECKISTFVRNVGSRIFDCTV